MSAICLLQTKALEAGWVRESDCWLFSTTPSETKGSMVDMVIKDEGFKICFFSSKDKEKLIDSYY